MENKSISIYQCSWKHYAALAEIGASTFYETFRPHNAEEDMQLYLASNYSLDKIKVNLSNSSIHYFLGYVEGIDQGYVKLVENPKGLSLQGKIIELEKIYLRPIAQGSGLAKQLMELAIEKSRELDFELLYLGVWQENARALSFYKKMGFEIFDTRKFQLGSRLCEDYLLYIRL
jgi:ribosomal protein S18 acetylase RimI-like enzyme